MERNKENRKREKILQLRLSEEEHEKLAELCKSVSTTKSNLIRSFICKGQPTLPISPQSQKELENLYKALNKIGVNVNQIAKQLNTVNRRGDAIPTSCLDELSKVKRQLEKIDKRADEITTFIFENPNL
jgi:predicted DNA-binding protein